MKRGLVIGIILLVLVFSVLIINVGLRFTGEVIDTPVEGVSKVYIYAGGLVASKSSDSDTYDYYIQDHLGSNRKVLADGSIEEQTDDFYAFGEGKNNIGSGNDYKFTGKELDETGLYYYGARYYSPEIGRFIQADALTGSFSDPLSLNRYAYVRNNPLRYVDPSGNAGREFEATMRDNVYTESAESFARTVILLVDISPFFYDRDITRRGREIVGHTLSLLNSAELGSIPVVAVRQDPEAERDLPYIAYIGEIEWGPLEKHVIESTTWINVRVDDPDDFLYPQEIQQILNFRTISEEFSKPSGSAFENTGLQELLQGWGVENIILAGGCKHRCLLSTSKTAVENYNVYIYEDLTYELPISRWQNGKRSEWYRQNTNYYTDSASFYEALDGLVSK